MKTEIINIVPQPNVLELTGGYCSPEAQKNVDNILVPDGVCQNDQGTSGEKYTLDIKEDGIVAKGTKAGLFYARISFEQLKLQFPEAVPCMHIEDQPRFEHRGFMLDSSRHFFSEPDVMTLIDAASFFKLNRFHWHLTDDQGWRIEIDKYPRLTETGSVRSGSSFGIDEHQTGEYKGFYTKKQIRRIVRFAKDRNIEIIPEIEIPGHETAAIAAYPELGCTGMAVPVETRGGIFENLICAGRDECFDFMTDVLDEVMELFPFEEIHIGGDEAVKSHWRACPYCQSRMHELGLRDENALQQWFEIRIASYLRTKGKKTVVWNDSLRGSKLPAEDFTVQSWIGDHEAIADFADRGGSIINSDTTAYYLDYPYYLSDAWKVLTNPVTPAFLNADQAKQVKGLECLLWSERVPDLHTAVKQLFPRLPAMAEAAWTDEGSRDNETFFERYEGCSTLFSKRRLEGQAPREWWHMDDKTAAADRAAYEKMMGTPQMRSYAASDNELIGKEEELYGQR